jgi:hypothetical protein
MMSRLIRAIEFFKLGWNDYDSEPTPLDIIMLYKLRKMCRYFYRDKYHESSKKIALEIRRASILLREIIYQRQEKIALDNLLKKYKGKLKILPIKDYFEWVTTDKEGIDFDKELIELIKEYERRHKENRKELYKILNDSIDNWWC